MGAEREGKANRPKTRARRGTACANLPRQFIQTCENTRGATRTWPAVRSTKGKDEKAQARQDRFGDRSPSFWRECLWLDDGRGHHVQTAGCLCCCRFQCD